MLESARALVLLLFLNYVQEVLIARPILKPCPLSLSRGLSLLSAATRNTGLTPSLIFLTLSWLLAV